MIEEMCRDLYKSDPDWKLILLRYFNPVGAHPSGMCQPSGWCFASSICTALRNLNSADVTLSVDSAFPQTTRSTDALVQNLSVLQITGTSVQ